MPRPSPDEAVKTVIQSPAVYGYKAGDFHTRATGYAELKSAPLGSILPYSKGVGASHRDTLHFQKVGSTGFARLSSEADGNCFLWTFLYLTSEEFRKYDIDSMKKIARMVRRYLHTMFTPELEAVGRRLFREQIRNTGGVNITEEAHLDLDKNGTPGQRGPIEIDVMLGVIIGKFFGYNVIPLTITSAGAFKFDEVEQQVSFKTPGEDVVLINFHHGPPGHFEPIIYLNSGMVDATSEFTFRWSSDTLDPIIQIHNSGAVRVRRWRGGRRQTRRTGQRQRHRRGQSHTRSSRATR